MTKVYSKIVLGSQLKRMILVNFSFVNAISENFLHDSLSFTLKKAYTKDRKTRDSLQV